MEEHRGEPGSAGATRNERTRKLLAVVKLSRPSVTLVPHSA